jgi:hypothetical protein
MASAATCTASSVGIWSRDTRPRALTMADLSAPLSASALGHSEKMCCTVSSPGRVSPACRHRGHLVSRVGPCGCVLTVRRSGQANLLPRLCCKPVCPSCIAGKSFAAPCGFVKMSAGSAQQRVLGATPAAGVWQARARRLRAARRQAQAQGAPVSAALPHVGPALAHHTQAAGRLSSRRRSLAASCAMQC